MSNLGTCAHCGEAKTARTMPSGKVEVDSRVIRRRFCSDGCRAAASNDFPLRPCDHCGKDIPRRAYPSRGKLETLGTYATKRFCSRTCKTAAETAPCGTPAGPNRHRVRGEEPCDACKVAERSARRSQALVARGLDPASVTHGTFSGGMVGCKCRDCLTWRPVVHGKSQSYDDGCHCGPCTRAKVAEVDRWRTEEPWKFEAAIDRWRLSAKRRNDASREHAYHWHEQWTGPELEIAARADLTAAQVAAMIGRTIAGVQTARNNMRKDVEALVRGGFVSS